MTGTKIDGLEVAKNIKNKVSEITSDLKSKGINPCLATILVGDNPASATYVRNKHKACEEVGIITAAYKSIEGRGRSREIELLYKPDAVKVYLDRYSVKS